LDTTGQYGSNGGLIIVIGRAVGEKIAKHPVMIIPMVAAL
jgi:hypothetical protein